MLLELWNVIVGPVIPHMNEEEGLVVSDKQTTPFTLFIHTKHLDDKFLFTSFFTTRGDSSHHHELIRWMKVNQTKGFQIWNGHHIEI